MKERLELWAIPRNAVLVPHKDSSLVFNTRSGSFYGLNSTAVSVIRALESSEAPLGIDQLRRIISDQYDRRDISTDDVSRLLRALEARGIAVKGGKVLANRVAAAKTFFSLCSRIILGMLRLLPYSRSSTGSLWCCVMILIWTDLTLKIGGFECLSSLLASWAVFPCADKPVLSYNQVQPIFARAVGMYIRQPKCLHRSAALACFLRWCALDARVFIGIRHTPLVGHAWVELAGEVIHDDPRMVAAATDVIIALDDDPWHTMRPTPDIHKGAVRHE